MRTHNLKVWPEFFADLVSGAKPFEIRNDDRGYTVGDELVLEEYEPDGEGRYTGRAILRVVTYKFPGGRMGIPEGVCVLGLAARSNPRPEEGET